jgi:hypothetical protein
MRKHRYLWVLLLIIPLIFLTSCDFMWDFGIVKVPSFLVYAVVFFLCFYAWFSKKKKE